LQVKTHVAAAIALLTATALGATLVATDRVVTKQSLRRGSEDLAGAREAFNHLVSERVSGVAAQVRLITAQPIFRAHLSDAPHPDDLAILRTMADEYPRQLGAQFCLVIDQQAVWLASPGWPEGAATPEPLASAIRSALGGQRQFTITVIGGRLLLVVLEPAKFAEETLGAVAVGLAIDDTVARELAAITQSDVGLVAGGRLAGSSIRGEGRTELARTVEAGELSNQSVLLQLGPSKYVAGTFPLLPGATGASMPRLVLLHDWTPTQQFLDELQRQVVRAGLLVFACALTAGWLFSRRMSRPFQDIAAAARDIASGGNWTRKVPVRGSAEAMTTASAFNDMSTSLRHWYEEAQAKSERLQASYERFQAVTDSARDAIVSANEQGAITFWNRSATLIFGYDEREVDGMNVTALISPDDRLRCLEALASVQGLGAARIEPIIELTGVRRDGSTVPIELSLSARPTNGLLQTTAVVRDITERKRAQEALEQRDEQLRQAQKMEAIGRLAGGVAHDFNNMLMAITGFGTLVRDGLPDDDPLRPDIDEVLSASDRAASLTRQLLAFSRRQIVIPQIVALDRVVADTEKMLRRLIGEHIVYSSASQPGLGAVRADPGQMEQILINLCVNARDAMPDGGRLHVELKDVDLDAASAPQGLEPGPFVRLSVSDTGCGIDPAAIGHIFEPFFTTKQPGRGTGLGLATVYGITRQNGGLIEVKSEVGRGSTFHVYLPRLAASACSDEERTSELAVDQPVSETVLLVEDDDRVRTLVASVLRRRGYEVLEANCGDDALRLAQGHESPIHLLLSDIVMPGMNGRTVAARVIEMRRETRVLLMSGYSDEMAQAGANAQPQSLFIQKPFSAEALAAKIREALSGASVN
jgi:PAS domain S-box-containing protein